MVEINNHLRVALTVHDAAVVVAPEDEAETAKALITGIMSKAPEWATGLPVACEAGVGETYGDC
jgi:DNA polymerase I-like protein with 3'-5' exonuclease and polymerase domains